MLLLTRSGAVGGGNTAPRKIDTLRYS